MILLPTLNTIVQPVLPKYFPSTFRLIYWAQGCLVVALGLSFKNSWKYLVSCLWDMLVFVNSIKSFMVTADFTHLVKR